MVVQYNCRTTHFLADHNPDLNIVRLIRPNSVLQSRRLVFPCSIATYIITTYYSRPPYKPLHAIHLSFATQPKKLRGGGLVPQTSTDATHDFSGEEADDQLSDVLVAWLSVKCESIFFKIGFYTKISRDFCSSKRCWSSVKGVIGITCHISGRLLHTGS